MASLELPAEPRPPGRKLSYEEFLAWLDEDVRAEWVDGEVIILSPPADDHERVLELLLPLLKLVVEKDRSGWVRIAPFLVRLPNMDRAREPDLLFVKEERCHLVRPTYLDGAPDLVVEVTSPESFSRDRGEKFIEYEAAGVTEYWLIDPDRRQVELYRLGANGRYSVVPVREDGALHSAVVPGFWLRPEWLWQEPSPRVIDVARELGVV